MVDDSQLDPIDEQAKPIALAIGRAVLGAATLEMLMRVHIAQLRVAQIGMPPELSPELSALERLTAGQLLARLRDLDLPGELAERIAAVIDRRNDLIHHPLEDQQLMVAGFTGVDVDAVAARIDQIALDCQQIGNELIAAAFPALLDALAKALGVSTWPELADLVTTLDLGQVPDDLRQQFEYVRSMLDVIDLSDLGSEPS